MVSRIAIIVKDYPASIMKRPCIPFSGNLAGILSFSSTISSPFIWLKMEGIKEN